jgi:hypothetical protein
LRGNFPPLAQFGLDSVSSLATMAAGARRKPVTR